MKSSFQNRSTLPNNRTFLPTYACCQALYLRGLLESPDAALCRARSDVSAPVAVDGLDPGRRTNQSFGYECR